MKEQLLSWDKTMDASFAGKDYPGGEVSPPDPDPVSWYETEPFRPFEAAWKERWEFKPYYDRTKGYGIEKGKGKAKGEGKGKPKN